MTERGRRRRGEDGGERREEQAERATLHAATLIRPWQGRGLGLDSAQVALKDEPLLPIVNSMSISAATVRKQQPLRVGDPVHRRVAAKTPPIQSFADPGA